MRQTLLGQQLRLLRITLRHEEQARQQIAGPVHARLFAQLLAERHTLFQQGLGMLVLALIGGHSRPFAEVATALQVAALLPKERGGLLLSFCLKPRPPRSTLFPSTPPLRRLVAVLVVALP